MRVISKRRLKAFGERYPDALQPLVAWHQTVGSARWHRPDEVKATYKTASFLKDNRICFNIGGDKYRLIVRVNYAVGMLYVRWIGSHRDYDDLDANTV